MNKVPGVILSLLGFLVFLASACVPHQPDAGGAAESYLTSIDELGPVSLPSGAKLRVVATTSIVGDVVAQVGGDQIETQQLIPLGVDPHAFEPTPQDARALAEADVVFINGFGLEAFTADLIQQAGSGAPVISVSVGIAPLPFEGEQHEEHEEGEGEDHEHGADPHTWLDPNNVMRWTENIEETLSALDPDHAATYAANGDRYRASLAQLDGEIRQAIARIPAENRKLVTDHDELGYFADEYGFTIVGAVIPGTSSLAEPSAAQLAELLDVVAAERVPAVFVSSIVNPSLVETFAADAGIQVVTLYAHSLTDAEGPAPSYLDLMRYNANAIAEALTP
jgi:ABC-type Zn uptake system ZnuABC Zn-binding protein ZnuA